MKKVTRIKIKSPFEFILSLVHFKQIQQVQHKPNYCHTGRVGLLYEFQNPFLNDSSIWSLLLKPYCAIKKCKTIANELRATTTIQNVQFYHSFISKFILLKTFFVDPHFIDKPSQLCNQTVSQNRRSLVHE